MQKIFILMLLCLLAGSVVADDAQVKLKVEHIKAIHHFGDVHFLKGDHYFAVFSNVPVSIYALKNEKCLYAKHQQRTFYRVISAEHSAHKVILSFSDKITQKGQTHTLKYSISYVLKDNAGGYFAMMDKDGTDIAQTKLDWQKILSCVLKYAKELYEPIKECLQQPDILKCIKIIGPSFEVYKCISGETFFAIPQPKPEKGRAIVTQSIYFSWSWGHSSSFNPQPVYKEMPHPIIGFDSVNLSGCKNAWNIRIGGSVIGNNVAKVYLANVSYMCYPTFWSSRVSGSIRCIMQK